MFFPYEDHTKNQKVVHKNQNSPSRFIKEVSYTNTGEVAKQTEITVDEDKILEEEKYDGFYAVCTTLTDDIKDIIAVNKRSR